MMLVEWDVIPPDGYKIQRFGQPQGNDIVFDPITGEIRYLGIVVPVRKYFILEAEALLLKDLQLGEDFTFLHYGTKKIVCKRVSTYWQDIFVPYLIDNEVFCTFGDTPVERVTHTTGH